MTTAPRPFTEWIRVGDIYVRPGEVVAVHDRRDGLIEFWLQGNSTAFRLSADEIDVTSLLQHVGARPVVGQGG